MDASTRRAEQAAKERDGWRGKAEGLEEARAEAVRLQAELDTQQGVQQELLRTITELHEQHRERKERLEAAEQRAGEQSQRARHDERRWKDATRELKELKEKVAAAERAWGLDLQQVGEGKLPPRLQQLQESEGRLRAQAEAREEEDRRRKSEEAAQLRSRLGSLEEAMRVLRRVNAAAAVMSGASHGDIPPPQLPDSESGAEDGLAASGLSAHVMDQGSPRGGREDLQETAGAGAGVGQPGTALDPRWVRLRGLRRLLPGVAAAGAAMAREIKRLRRASKAAQQEHVGADGDADAVHGVHARSRPSRTPGRSRSRARSRAIDPRPSGRGSGRAGYHARSSSREASSDRDARLDRSISAGTRRRHRPPASPAAVSRVRSILASVERRSGRSGAQAGERAGTHSSSAEHVRPRVRASPGAGGIAPRSPARRVGGGYTTEPPLPPSRSDLLRAASP